MKKILNWIFAVLGKIGKDKYQHFTLGALITTVAFLVLQTFCKPDLAWWLSLFVTFGAEFCKEFIIDDEGSPLDFFATMLGWATVGIPLFTQIFLG